MTSEYNYAVSKYTTIVEKLIRKNMAKHTTNVKTEGIRKKKHNRNNTQKHIISPNNDFFRQFYWQLSDFARKKLRFLS